MLVKTFFGCFRCKIKQMGKPKNMYFGQQIGISEIVIGRICWCTTPLKSTKLTEIYIKKWLSRRQVQIYFRLIAFGIRRITNTTDEDSSSRKKANFWLFQMAIQPVCSQIMFVDIGRRLQLLQSSPMQSNLNKGVGSKTVTVWRGKISLLLQVVMSRKLWRNNRIFSDNSDSAAASLSTNKKKAKKPQMLQSLLSDVE